MTRDAPALRIACLTGAYPKPSHTFIQREVAALRDLGADVRTASIRRPGPQDLTGPEEEAAAATTFYVLERARRPMALLADHARLFARGPGRWLSTLALALRTGRPGAKGLLWQIFYFLEAGVLAAWLGRERATRLHVHFADSGASVGMLAARMAGVPFSFSLHGPTEFFAAEAWRLDEKIARADIVACISHFARSQAMIFSDPDHWPKLRIVHCGVDPDRYAGARAAPGDGLRLLFVGRLTQLKGLRILFEAMEALRPDHPDLTLTVIGDGPERRWAEAEAARIGGIALLGLRSQDEVARALGQADALVLPSFAEGLPVVFMEALAAGIPVIASRIAGTGELVSDGETGLLVAPGDAPGLAQAIARLAGDAPARDRMGAAGQARVRADFDSRTEAARLLTLFRGAGGDAVRPPPAQP